MLTKLKQNLKLLVLLIFGLALTGCANIQYNRIIDTDGKVTDRVVIELDLQALSSAGYNTNQLISSIENDLQLFYLANVTDYKTAVQNNVELSTEVKTQLLQNIETTVYTTVDHTKIVASITFATLEDFNAYYGWLDEQNPDSSEEENQVTQIDGYFFTTYVQASPNVFGNLQTGNLSSITNYYLQTLNLEDHFSLNDVTLAQLYASPNTSLDSNATEITLENGLKVHMWTLDPLQDTTLEFYNYSPNQWAW